MVNFYSGRFCPYCLKETELVDSQTVHQDSHGMIYLCAPCQAWVGTKYGDQGLGFVAKQSLRNLRREAFQLFSRICKRRAELGVKERTAFLNGYKWVASFLNIETDESHFSFFDEDQCKQVISECKKFIPGTEEHQEHQKLITQEELRTYGEIQLVAEDLNIPIQKETTSVLLVQFPKKQAFIDIKKLKACWKGETKWFPLGNIQNFFKKHYFNAT